MSNERKRAEPKDFGIPEELWQAAAEYAGAVLHEFNGQVVAPLSMELEVEAAIAAHAPTRRRLARYAIEAARLEGIERAAKKFANRTGCELGGTCQ